MKRIALATTLGLCLLPALLRAETPLLEITAAAATVQARFQSCRQTAAAAHRQASDQCQDQGYAYARLVPTEHPLCAVSEEGEDESFKAAYQCVEQRPPLSQALSRTCDDCYSKAVQDPFCRTLCGCSSVFCGAW